MRDKISYSLLYNLVHLIEDRSVGKNAASSTNTSSIVRFEIPDSLHQPIKTLEIHLWLQNLSLVGKLQAARKRGIIIDSQVHKVHR